MTGSGFSRRGVLTGLGAIAASWADRSFARQVVKDIKALKPGEYTWHPERSARGPVSIVVSLPEQLVHIYRNGVRIAVSTCSTGKKGHRTPTGVFTILQKDKHHRSSTYNNAPMPNMNRLTWGGIALHAGRLPGYPASHGCIRLPLKFSAKLFTITHIGTPVIIAGSHADPWELTHPGLVLGQGADEELRTAVGKLKGRKHPSDWPKDARHPITTVIASSADRTLVLIENEKEIVRGRLTIKGPAKLGEHVFALKASSRSQYGFVWKGITHHVDPAHPNKPEESVIRRMEGDKPFVAAMRKSLHPGMLFIVTDLPLHPDRRSGPDFVIMTAG